MRLNRDLSFSDDLLEHLRVGSQRYDAPPQPQQAPEQPAVARAHNVSWVMLISFGLLAVIVSFFLVNSQRSSSAVYGLENVHLTVGDRDEVKILAESAYLLSSPDGDCSSSIVMPAGESVKIIGKASANGRGYLAVELLDGVTGWIEQESVR